VSVAVVVVVVVVALAVAAAASAVVIVTIRKTEKPFPQNFRIMSIKPLCKLIHMHTLNCTNLYIKNIYVYRKVVFMTNMTVLI